MSNTMQYLNYIARVTFSDQDNIFVGEVMNVRDSIGFHGDSVQELRASFQEAVDAYLAACEEAGQEPGRPFSGSFRLRLEPELHQTAAHLAAMNGQSLNTFIADLVAERAGKRAG